MGETAVALGAAAAVVGVTVAWLRHRGTERQSRREEATLRAAAAALTRTGADFLPAVARTIATALGAELTVIAEVSGDNGQTLAAVRDFEPAPNFAFAVHGSAAAQLAGQRQFCTPDRVCELFPDDDALAAAGARGCVGVALIGAKQELIGLILAATRRPIASPAEATALLTMFAGRVAVEIERARAERELRRSEEHLLQAQRVEAIGRLAGGIAHDFNNLLMIMIGYAEILRDRNGTSPELTELLAAANRATTLTRQLLAFGRRQVLQMQRLDMNGVVTQVQTLVAPVIGQRVRVTTCLDPALPAVEADPGQMEQVLVNLALNARDAMPQGGTLHLETRTAHVEQPYYQMPAGTYVCLEVSDTGIGMTPEVQAHIFEPFFTTKGASGTGLGLSSVYGIVKQSGGFIWCQSEPGKGTRFTIYLNPARSEPVQARPEAGTPVRAHGGRVLVVDDEPSVRQLLVQLLRTRGYVVDEAEDAVSALAFLSQPAHRVDLVVTDVVMPGMSGVELAREIGDRWPGLKVLFVSGYAQNAAGTAGAAPAGIPVLAKPFTPSRMASAVRELLDGLPPEPHAQAAG